MAESFVVPVRGPFSLEEAVGFGFAQRSAEPYRGVMTMAFCTDGDLDRHVAVELRPDGREIHGVLHGDGDRAGVVTQVARILSLDHDGDEFQAIGQADPVIGRLQAVAPGLRPPLFHSPYEAAVWSVLSARRPGREMIAYRARLSEQHGTVFELAGQRRAALPGPRRLLEIEDWPGLPEEKVNRIRGVAAAALEGRLDVNRLHDLGPEAADDELRALRGIGRFYASLIVVRAVGFVDVLPVEERHLPGLVQRLYGLDGPPDQAVIAALAEKWRPFRTWATVLVRAAGPRLLGDPPTAR